MLAPFNLSMAHRVWVRAPFDIVIWTNGGEQKDEVRNQNGIFLFYDYYLSAWMGSYLAIWIYLSNQIFSSLCAMRMDLFIFRVIRVYLLWTCSLLCHRWRIKRTVFHMLDGWKSKLLDVGEAIDVETI